MTGKAGLVPWKRLYVKQPPPTASPAAPPLPWPFGLHVAGYKYKITHTHTRAIPKPKAYDSTKDRETRTIKERTTKEILLRPKP